jgi:hypothetical protein
MRGLLIVPCREVIQRYENSQPNSGAVHVGCSPASGSTMNKGGCHNGELVGGVIDRLTGIIALVIGGKKPDALAV